MRFQPNGQNPPISAKERGQAQASVRAFIAKAPVVSERWQHAILKWSQMLPEERTTSPWTKEPMRVAAGRWLMQARTKRVITDCAEEAPWHPLEPVSLARLDRSLLLHLPIAEDPASGSLPKSRGVDIEKIAIDPDDVRDDEGDPRKKHPITKRKSNIPIDSIDEKDLTQNSTDFSRIDSSIRSRFLARLTLKRLHEADEKLYGRDTLAEYAAWAAKILHSELHLTPEALEALAFALERTPPDKQQNLLDLKAKIGRSK
jgi:hypothetical protein